MRSAARTHHCDACTDLEGMATDRGVGDPQLRGLVATPYGRLTRITPQQ